MAVMVMMVMMVMSILLLISVNIPTTHSVIAIIVCR